MTDDRDKTQPVIHPGAGREETHRTSGGLVATAFGLTDIGCQRSVNQDTLGNLVGQHADRSMELGLLYAVADGMGGHARGEVASALAIQHLFARYYGIDPGEDPRRALAKVLVETNGAVHQAGRDAGGAAMGTTLTLALLRDHTLFIGNIGDSRTYCIRNGRIEQLTHDHSLIGEQVRSGLLTEAQARQSSIRNVITRAVGYREEVEPDVFTFPVAVGDIVLLCSDGLHSMVDSQELAQALSTQPLGAAVPALIELAKQRGGPDNITALAVRIDALGAAATTREEVTTVPMTPSLNDAVTKPFVRAEGGEEAGGEAVAAAAGAASAPSQPPPPPPGAPPQASVPPAPPAPLAPPAPSIPAPPATRPPRRFPVGLLVVLPLLLLAVAGAGLVALSRSGANSEPTVAAAVSPTAGLIGAASPATTTPTSTPAALSTSSVAGAPVSTPTVTTLGALGTPTRAPQTSGTGPTPVVGTATPPVAATSTRSGGTDNMRVILEGPITFSGQIPPEELEVVVFIAADLPNGIGETPPPPAQLTGRTPTWVGAITAQADQTFRYEVRGEWKGGQEERAVVALRRKGSAQVVYPDVQSQTLVTLSETQPTGNHSLIFTRPAP